MNLETTRLRGRPGNRWQDEVSKDGGLVGKIEWREREEWKELLNTTRKFRILHMAVNE